jgi:hypothetical protein
MLGCQTRSADRTIADSTTSQTPRVVAADTSSAPSHSCGAKTISADGVGEVRIGVAIDAVKARCDVARDTVQPGPEGMTERRSTVSFPPDVLDAEIVNEKVWRLDVRSPAFRTGDSLGVGSTLGDLLRLPRVQGMIGEGILVVVSPDRCGLSFVLSGGIPPGRVRNWDRKALSALPASTKVARVLVLGCAAKNPDSAASG